METKPWYKSVTVISAVAFSVLQTLEQNGVVPVGVGQSLVALVQNLLIVLGAYGIRRAVG